MVADITGLIGNSTGFMQYLQYLNTESQGLFGLLWILAVFVTVFASAMMWKAGKAFTVASFTAFVVSVLLAILGLVDETVVIVLMLATIITAFIE